MLFATYGMNLKTNYGMKEMKNKTEGTKCSTVKSSAEKCATTSKNTSTPKAQKPAK